MDRGAAGSDAAFERSAGKLPARDLLPECNAIAAGSVARQSHSQIGKKEAAMRTLVLLSVVMTVAAAGVASAIKPLTSVTVAAPSPQHVTISIEELQRQIDARLLPELEISDLY